nr:hypothetical protein [Bacteroides intestinalis]
MKKKSNSKKMLLSSMAIASSAMIVSCDFNPEIMNLDDSTIQDNIHNALSMRFSLSKEDWSYVNFLNSLTIELVNSQDAANEFALSPNEFIKKAGYNDIGFSINDRVAKSILALADKDIQNKLRENDLKGFIKLCKEKEYIEDFSGNILQYLKHDMISTRADFTNGDFWYYVVVQMYEFYLLALIPSMLLIDNKSISQQPVFEVLLLSEDEKNTYIACEQYIVDEVNIIIDCVKEENPDLTEEQILELTNFLKKNLIQINDFIKHE